MYDKEENMKKVFSTTIPVAHPCVTCKIDYENIKQKHLTYLKNIKDIKITHEAEKQDVCDMLNSKYEEFKQDIKHLGLEDILYGIDLTPFQFECKQELLEICVEYSKQIHMFSDVNCLEYWNKNTLDKMKKYNKNFCSKNQDNI